jgi:hypothetical protein
MQLQEAAYMPMRVHACTSWRMLACHELLQCPDLCTLIRLVLHQLSMASCSPMSAALFCSLFAAQQEANLA